ncbi:MAG: hypothetical protein ACR2L2_06455, partial [Acidobacteriota bacterium]
MTDPLAYFGTASGDVIVTDAAIAHLASIRRWALLWIILLLFYAGVGGFLGVILLLTVIESRAEPDFPMFPLLTVSLANLLFAPLALISAIH